MQPTYDYPAIRERAAELRQAAVGAFWPALVSSVASRVRRIRTAIAQLHGPVKIHRRA